MYRYYFVSKRTQIATNPILIGFIVKQTNIYQAHGNPVILFECIEIRVTTQTDREIDKTKI